RCLCRPAVCCVPWKMAIPHPATRVHLLTLTALCPSLVSGERRTGAAQKGNSYTLKLVLTFRANNREKNQIELSSWDEQTDHSQARANRRYPGHQRAVKEDASGQIDRTQLL